MKKPAIPLHRRPGVVRRRNPRSRTEAAVELVRLEFDSARLERELGQAERRASQARLGLADARARAAGLGRLLATWEEPGR